MNIFISRWVKNSAIYLLFLPYAIIKDVLKIVDISSAGAG